MLPVWFCSGHATAPQQADPGFSAGTLALMALSRVSACWRKAVTSRASCRASWCSFRVPCSRSHLCGWKWRGGRAACVQLRTHAEPGQGEAGGRFSVLFPARWLVVLGSAHASSTHVLLRCLRRAEMLRLSLLPCFSSFWAKLFSSLCRLWNCCSSWPKWRDRHQHRASGICSKPQVPWGLGSVAQ